MKQIRSLIWLIPLALLLVGVFSFAYTRTTSAAISSTTPSVRMLSTSYNLPSLGGVGTPPLYQTVERLSFSVTSTAKMEMTAVNPNMAS